MSEEAMRNKLKEAPRGVQQGRWCRGGAENG